MGIRRKRSRLTPIEKGLADVLGTERLSRLAEISRLQRRWHDIVGPMLAGCTRPVAIEAGCLIIAVNHPSVSQQIRFLQQEIREACFRTCKVGGISRLRTRVQPDTAVRAPVQRTAPRPVPLSERKKFAAELRRLNNHELKLSIFRARIAQRMFRA